MPKLGEVKHIPTTKHFFKDDKLAIACKRDSKNRFTEFEVTVSGETKVFPIVKYNILAAWKEVEKWTSDKLKK